MKINNKAFTLIELLAVIVILAIIALIATPIVLSIINDSKESAGLRSAEMYLDAVEQSISLEKMNNTSFDPNICNIDKVNLNCEGIELKVEVNGEVPESGIITFEDGKIKVIELTYTNGKTIVKNSEGNLVYGKIWTLTKAQGNTRAKAEIGDTITINLENFYVYSNKDGYIKAIAKYNLYVGGEYDNDNSVWTAYDTTVEGYGLQHIDMKGYVSGQTVRKGTTAYSSSSSDYVGSIVEGYVKTYKTKLESMGATFIDNLDDAEDPDDQLAGSGVRLITKKELEELGCSSSSNTCSGAPSFVTETSYWSGSAYDSDDVWLVYSNGAFSFNGYSYGYSIGVRPIITILESSI